MSECGFVLAGECLGGALWWKDLLQLAKEVGFSPPRLVTASVITVDNKELQDVLGLMLFPLLFTYSFLSEYLVNFTPSLGWVALISNNKQYQTDFVLL